MGLRLLFLVVNGIEIEGNTSGVNAYNPNREVGFIDAVDDAIRPRRNEELSIV